MSLATIVLQTSDKSNPVVVLRAIRGWEQAREDIRSTLRNAASAWVCGTWKWIENRSHLSFGSWSIHSGRQIKRYVYAIHVVSHLQNDLLEPLGDDKDDVFLAAFL